MFEFEITVNVDSFFPLLGSELDKLEESNNDIMAAVKMVYIETENPKVFLLQCSTKVYEYKKLFERVAKEHNLNFIAERYKSDRELIIELQQEIEELKSTVRMLLK